jgi:hypothetical protein
VLIRAKIQKMPCYATAEEPLASEEGYHNERDRMVGITTDPLDQITPLAKPT